MPTLTSPSCGCMWPGSPPDTMARGGVGFPLLPRQSWYPGPREAPASEQHFFVSETNGGGCLSAIQKPGFVLGGAEESLRLLAHWAPSVGKWQDPYTLILCNGNKGRVELKRKGSITQRELLGGRSPLTHSTVPPQFPNWVGGQTD